MVRRRLSRFVVRTFSKSSPEIERCVVANFNERSERSREICACAEVDPLLENGVQKAMFFVKSDFGIAVANQLVERAHRHRQFRFVMRLISTNRC